MRDDLSPKPETSNTATNISSPKKPVFPYLEKIRPATLVSIRRQHLFLILLLLIPLFGYQLFSAYTEYQSQRSVVLTSQLNTARTAAQVVTTFINDLINNNSALSYSFRNTENLSTSEGNIILADFRKDKKYLAAYRFVSVKGQTLYSDPPQLLNTLLAEENYYKQLEANNNQYVVSDLYTSQLDGTTPIFSVVSPVRDTKGNLAGLLAADIDTTKLGEVLSVKFSIGERGSFSVHDRRGYSVYNNLIPSETYSRRLERAKTIVPSVRIALDGREMVQDYVRSGIDNMEKMGASAPIKLIGWAASIAVPVEDVMASTNQIIATRIILFSVVAFLALLGAWLYSNYLTRPLLLLGRVATNFGQGNLDARAPLARQNTEIAELTNTFNQMADKVAEETRSKDAFLSQAAHELKTPLTIIKSSSQLLILRQEKELNKLNEANSSTTQPDNNQLKLLKNIDYQTSRMTGLINRLLELSRFEIGRYEFKLASLNLALLTEKCIESARMLTTAERHPISFDWDRQASLDKWLMQGDTERLEQVILNLAENAIKYSPDGGSINLQLLYHPATNALQPAQLELIVSDKGLGLNPEESERLFQRYYRARNNERSISGLGLGLYISAEIITSHGGKIWASSAGPGSGSEFHILLPQNQPSSLKG